jgi:hypothetical protein
MIRNLRLSPSSFNEKNGTPCRDELIQLASWYRAQAERAGSTWVWEAQLQRAEELEAEARHKQRCKGRQKTGPCGRDE